MGNIFDQLASDVYANEELDDEDMEEPEVVPTIPPQTVKPSGGNIFDRMAAQVYSDEKKTEVKTPSMAATAFQKGVVEPAKYLGGQAKQAIQGMGHMMDPNVWMGTQEGVDVMRPGRTVEKEPMDLPPVSTRKFIPDTYVGGRRMEFSPARSALSETAVEQLGPTAGATSAFFTGSPETGQRALSQVASEFAQEPMESTPVGPGVSTVSNLAGYAVGAGAIEKLGMKMLPQVKTLVQAGSVPATAFKNMMTFGIEGARRAYAEGGNVIDAFWQNAFMGAGFGVAEAKFKAAEMSKQRTTPQGSMEFEVDPELSAKNAALEQERASALEASQRYEGIKGAYDGPPSLLGGKFERPAVSEAPYAAREFEIQPPVVEKGPYDIAGSEAKGGAKVASKAPGAAKEFEVPAPLPEPKSPYDVGAGTKPGKPGAKAPGAAREFNIAPPEKPAITEPYRKEAFSPPSKGELPKATYEQTKAQIGAREAVPVEAKTPETSLDVPKVEIGKNGKQLKMYSGFPVDALTDALGKDNVIKKIFNKEIILKDDIRGYPMEQVQTKLEGFFRRWFKAPYSDQTQNVAELFRTAKEKIPGSQAMADEYVTFLKGKTPEQVSTLKKIIYGETTPSNPEFTAEVKRLGIQDKDVRVAHAFRTFQDYVGEDLYRGGMISDEAFRLDRGKYVKQLYKEHLEDMIGKERTFETPGGIKKIHKKNRDISADYIKEHGVEDPSIAMASYPQDVRRVQLAKIIDEGKRDGVNVLRDEDVAKLGDLGKAKKLTLDGRRYSMWKEPQALPEHLDTPTGRKVFEDVYGDRGLKGKWVLDEYKAALEDLMGLPSQIDGTLDKFLEATSNTKMTQMRGWWKAGKAVWNPANTVGNAIWNQLASGAAFVKAGPIARAKLLKASFKDVMSKSEEYLVAKNEGTFGGHFGVEDFRRTAKDALGIKTKVENLDDVFALVDKGMNKSGFIYQMTEEVYKMAAFKYAKQFEGMSNQAAMRFAQKHFYNYRDVSKGVKLLRTVPFGPAFITFSTKMLPRSVEYLRGNPIALLKYPVALKILHEYNQKKYGFSDLDLENFRKDLSKYAQKTADYMPLVGAKKEGDKMIPIFLDIKYILPYADVLGTAKDGFFKNFFFSGPEMGVAELAMNKRKYDDQDIVREPEVAETEEEVEGYGEHIFRTFSPQVFVNMKNVYDAASGKKNFSGEPKRDLTQEIMKTSGFPVNVPKAGTSNIRLMDKTFKVKNYMSRTAKDMSIDEETRERRMNQALEKLDKWTKEYEPTEKPSGLSTTPDPGFKDKVDKIKANKMLTPQMKTRMIKRAFDEYNAKVKQ